VATNERDDSGRLGGRVAIVSVGEPDAARALAAAGASVVVVGSDATATGALVRSLVDGGHRAVAFVGDAAHDAAALGEMVAELFPDRDLDGPEPA
jgi:hypothetical protein